MTKPCTHCGGWGYTYDAPLDDVTLGAMLRRRCDHCAGAGKMVDDAEYEPETCHNCDGNGCRRCKGTGETWRKVDSEPAEEAEE